MGLYRHNISILWVEDSPAVGKILIQEDCLVVVLPILLRNCDLSFQLASQLFLCSSWNILANIPVRILKEKLSSLHSERISLTRIECIEISPLKGNIQDRNSCSSLLNQPPHPVSETTWRHQQSRSPWGWWQFCKNRLPRVLFRLFSSESDVMRFIYYGHHSLGRGKKSPEKNDDLGSDWQELFVCLNLFAFAVKRYTGFKA